MRLKEILAVLEEHRGSLKLSVVDAPAGSGQVASQEAKAPLLDALRALLEVAALHHDAAALIADEVLRAHPHLVFGQTHLVNNFGTRLATFRTKVDLLTTTLHAMVPAPTEMVVSFRVPDTDSLDELISDMNVLNQAFRRTMALGHHESEYKLDGFDRGSDWLLVALATPAALVHLHTLLSKAAEYISQRREGARMAKHLAKTLKKPELEQQHNDDLHAAYIEEASVTTARELRGVAEPDPAVTAEIREVFLLWNDFITKGGYAELPASAGEPGEQPEARLLNSDLRALAEGKVPMGLLTRGGDQSDDE